MKKQLAVMLILIAGCTTAQAPAAQPAANPELENLQVLPRDITREQLLATMRSFTRGLGVRCNHCHVVTATEPKEVLDFPSDAKEEKRVARVMLRMVNEINGTWMHRVEEAEGEHVDASAPPELKVVCWTCHRGKTEPEAPPPPPPPAESP